VGARAGAVVSAKGAVLSVWEGGGGQRGARVDPRVDPTLGARQIPRADGGTRTPDPFITSEVLYQLSYVGRDR
jgi:hypothetical protein